MILKPYLSYWTHGYQNRPNDTIINYHKLSARLALKNFGEVHFITDKESFYYFKDIPWTSVEFILEDVPKIYSKVWSISKLYAYKYIAMKGSPFIHIDYDVFIWKELPKEIIESNIFAQCLEQNMGIRYDAENVLKQCKNLHIFNFNLPKDGINMGIFGGSDLDFIYKYSDSAINFITDPENMDFWQNGIFVEANDHACIAEQYYLTAFAGYNNQNIDFLFHNGWPSEEEAIIKGYTHLMYGKGYPDIQEKTKELIKLLE